MSRAGLRVNTPDAPSINTELEVIDGRTQDLTDVGDHSVKSITIPGTVSNKKGTRPLTINDTSAGVYGQAWIKGRAAIGQTAPDVNPDGEILLRIGSGNSLLPDVDGNASATDAIGAIVCANLRAVANLVELEELQVSCVFTDDGSARTITSGYGIYVRNYTKGAATTITTMYGLRVNVPTIGATNIGARIGGGVMLDGDTSGTLLIKPSAVAGTNTLTLPAGTTDFSATGGANQFVQQSSAGGALTVAAITSTDVPNLDASKITTGQLALARGGTHADLSATGGASKFLKQASAGADITVVQPAASDLTNGTTGSGSVVLATAPTVTTLNVSDKNLQLNAAQFQSFVLVIRNSAGTLQHGIFSSQSEATASNVVGKVTGASTTYATMPYVAAGTNFTSGGGSDNTSKANFIFNTAAQVDGDPFVMATVEYNSTGTGVVTGIRPRNINVNGTTRNWLAAVLFNATTGAAFTIDTTNIPAATQINIRIYGFVY